MVEQSINIPKDSSELHSKLVNPYLRDFLYGAMDGIVTTFAVVCGVAGAHLSSGVVVVLGLANLIGDGFSMGVSNFMGTRSEQKQRKRALRIERSHVKKFPRLEKDGIRKIFSQKGFQGDDLEKVVTVLTQDEGKWTEEILLEELGMSAGSNSAVRSALVTFLAFVLIGVLPLIPFLYDVIFSKEEWRPFLTSSTMTAVAFFAVGTFKSRFLDEKWYRGATETLLMGGTAAVIAYVVARLLRDLAHVT